MPRRAEIAGRRNAGGGALSAFGQKSVLNAVNGGSHLAGVRNPVLEPLNRLDGTARDDTTMLVNETEWPAMAAGRMSYGKYRVI